MGAAWKVYAILDVNTEATFTGELRRQADDNAPCLLAREILPALMIQIHAGRLLC
jgi:hypothetical protein